MSPGWWLKLYVADVYLSKVVHDTTGRPSWRAMISAVSVARFSGEE